MIHPTDPDAAGKLVEIFWQEYVAGYPWSSAEGVQRAKASLTEAIRGQFNAARSEVEKYRAKNLEMGKRETDALFREMTARQREQEARNLLAEVGAFLKHSGNQRSILSGQWATPSARFDWFTRTNEAIRAFLAAPAQERGPAPPRHAGHTSMCESGDAGAPVSACNCGAYPPPVTLQTEAPPTDEELHGASVVKRMKEATERHAFVTHEDGSVGNRKCQMSGACHFVRYKSFCGKSESDPVHLARICAECGSALDDQGHIADYPCSRRDPVHAPAPQTEAPKPEEEHQWARRRDGSACNVCGTVRFGVFL
jgi:hypothetical protein